MNSPPVDLEDFAGDPDAVLRVGCALLVIAVIGFDGRPALVVLASAYTMGVFAVAVIGTLWLLLGKLGKTCLVNRV